MIRLQVLTKPEEDISSNNCNKLETGYATWATVGTWKGENSRAESGCCKTRIYDFFLGGGEISVIKMSSALARVKKFVILKENLNSHLLNTKYLG